MQLTNVNQVIDALGGTTATAVLSRRLPSTVSMWRSSGRIPADFFLRHTRALADAGYTAPPKLWGMEPETVPGKERVR